MHRFYYFCSLKKKKDVFYPPRYKKWQFPRNIIHLGRIAPEKHKNRNLKVTTIDYYWKKIENFCFICRRWIVHYQNWKSMNISQNQCRIPEKGLETIP